MKPHYFNTLRQILVNESVHPISGILRQIDWFLIRLFNRFPRYESLSKSILFVTKPNGPAALVHILGKYDYHNMNLVQEILREHPGLWFIDVGANIGIYSLLAAETGANVLAIEPHPRTYATLLKNIEINGYTNIITENCAAYEKKSSLRFTNLQEDAINKIQDDGELIVNGIPVDALIEKYKIGKFIMKIDTEGFDYYALLGASNSLVDCHLVIIEEKNHNIRELLNVNNFDPGKYYNHTYKNFSYNPQARCEDLVFVNKMINLKEYFR